MQRDDDKLKLAQTEDLIRPFRRLANAPTPRGGWVRAIREALGMSAAQLARRVGVSRQTVEDFERNEAAGKIAMESLNKLASAMDCRVVYSLVPRKPLSQMQRERASIRAKALVKPASHSMKLEAQSLTKREELRQRERLVQSLLQGDPRKMWD